MEMAARRQMNLVIGDVVEFVVHVARGIHVDTGGDECHHHEHQHGQGVDVPADRERECTAVVERVPVARVGDRTAARVMVAMRFMMRAVIGRAGGDGIVTGIVTGIVNHGGGMRIVNRSRHGMGDQPGSQGSQRKHQRRGDGCGSHPGGVPAMGSHAGAEEQNGDERDQRGKPREAQQHRKLRRRIHVCKPRWRLSPSGRRRGRCRRWHGCCRSST